MINQNHMIRNHFHSIILSLGFQCSFFNFIIILINNIILFYFQLVLQSSMKSKKIVYFGQTNPDDKINARKQSTSKNKNISSGKGLRDISSNKNKNINQTSRGSGLQKVSSSQKIKIMLTKDGFIFEKKYLIYEIQCTLTKKDKEVSSKKIKTNTNIQNDQSFTISDQDVLYLNLESSSYGVTKTMVRQNFAIERDNLSYVEVKVQGYHVQNIIISNKKIEFVQNQNADTIDQQQITVIEPIKSIEISQSIRQQKINTYIQEFAHMKNQGFRTSKSLNFCWNLESGVENGQNMTKHGHKKSDLQNLALNNSYCNSSQPVTNRESSKTKRMNSLMCQTNLLYKQKEKQSIRVNLNELMKPTKQILTKSKIGSKKVLNDSGVTYNVISKTEGKQNKREDVYGLEQMSKKIRSKTGKNGQNGQNIKRMQPIQALDQNKPPLERQSRIRKIT